MINKINKNEKGFTLILSLVLLMVMSLMGGALIVISSGDHQSNNTSDQYQQAFYVAETGLLEAEKAISSSIASRKMAFLRYCEFNKIEGGKITETAMFFDIPHI